MTRFSCTCAVVVVAALMPVSQGSGFLKAHGTGLTDQISKQEVQKSLLEEIESSLGTGTAAKKLQQIEDELTPMFAALPKNEHGGLGHSVARYALHRIFVQRHGWVVKGLDPAGGSFNASSPAVLLKTQVSSYIQELFEERLHGKGLRVHELAVFAATIEHLIHSEAIGRLGGALAVYGILPTSPLSEMAAHTVLDVYMMSYILGKNLTGMTLSRANFYMKQMPDIYPAWQETRKFMQGVQRNITAAMTTHEINFATLASVIQTVSEHFGSFQDADCQSLKAKLVAIEDRGSGRVRLSDFYKPALDGAWEFQESIGYLRKLGVLDESDPKYPRVIIANYMVSQTNCIAPSSFYSVCCLNECEALLGHIEEQVAFPEATPERLASLVANLPSRSISVPRDLSSTLLQRLNAISEGHGGMIPIHGRLFAQWMHHAFPKECPYPHLSGTTIPQTPDEWLEIDIDPEATQAEMLNYTIPVNEDEELGELEMPWSHEEELLVVRAPHTVRKEGPSTMWTAFRTAMLFSTFGPMALGVVRMLKFTTASRACDKSDKLFV